MRYPDPENTGNPTYRRGPQLPQGSSGFTTTGGQVLYPGDVGGDTTPWDTGSALQQLLQSLAGGGASLGSIFGMNGGSSAFPDFTSLLGPPGQVTGKQVSDFVDGLHRMPAMGGYNGMFGQRNDDIRHLLLNFATSLHRIGDPTRGRVPGTAGRQAPDLPSSSDLEAKARRVSAELLKAWADHKLHAHDPNRGSPTRGGPHPEWSSDPTAISQTRDADGTLHIKYSDGSETTILPRDPTLEAIAAVSTTASAVGVGIAVTKVTQSPTLGVIAGLGIGALVWHLTHRSGGFPSDDGGGVGPRSRSDVYLPDPDSSGGGYGGPRGVSVMPDPESGSGGRPRGHAYQASSSSTLPGGSWFPDPDSSGGVGPRT